MLLYMLYIECYKNSRDEFQCFGNQKNGLEYESYCFIVALKQLIYTQSLSSLGKCMEWGGYKCL